MNNIKIVCMGDSLTEGYGIDKTKRWSDLLSEDLGCEIINSGISGDTTAGMLARFHHMALAHQPTHIIITGGTNDLWFTLSNQQIISNILAMTRHARHNNIESIIGIPTPFYCRDTPGTAAYAENKDFEKRLRLFSEALTAFAESDERKYIDFSRNMTPDLFLEDGLHPDENGHIVMKENAEIVLQDILARRRTQ
ncbi:MAG: hypothetical protein GY765_43560 [bacterium]|nr:hypothetical protein [bacterium]